MQSLDHSALVARLAVLAVPRFARLLSQVMLPFRASRLPFKEGGDPIGGFSASRFARTRKTTIAIFAWQPGTLR